MLWKETCSESSVALKMEHFAKIAKNFTKSFILDVSLGSIWGTDADFLEPLIAFFVVLQCDAKKKMKLIYFYWKMRWNSRGKWVQELAFTNKWLTLLKFILIKFLVTSGRHQKAPQKFLYNGWGICFTLFKINCYQKRCK